MRGGGFVDVSGFGFSFWKGIGNPAEPLESDVVVDMARWRLEFRVLLFTSGAYSSSLEERLSLGIVPFSGRSKIHSMWGSIGTLFLYFTVE